MKWFQRVSSQPGGDFDALAQALEWFEKEYENGKKELKPQGRIVDAEARLAGNSEYYYGIAMEIEAIMKWLELETEKVIGKWRKAYLENYPKELSATTAEKYANSLPEEVLALKELAITVGLMRSKFHGLTSGLTTLHYQLTNITNLHKAGIEDHEL